MSHRAPISQKLPPSFFSPQPLRLHCGHFVFLPVRHVDGTTMHIRAEANATIAFLVGASKQRGKYAVLTISVEFLG